MSSGILLKHCGQPNNLTFIFREKRLRPQWRHINLAVRPEPVEWNMKNWVVNHPNWGFSITNVTTWLRLKPTLCSWSDRRLQRKCCFWYLEWFCKLILPSISTQSGFEVKDLKTKMLPTVRQSVSLFLSLRKGTEAKIWVFSVNTKMFREWWIAGQTSVLTYCSDCFLFSVSEFLFWTF